MFDSTSIAKKFAAMGARLKVGTLRPGSSPRPDRNTRFTLDIGTDKKGEFFELLLRPGADPEFLVLDVQPALRHLVLHSEEVLDPARGRNGIDRHALLCGHDERHWFVAGVQNGASVTRAIESLKPRAALESLARNKVKQKNRNKRKNKGFIRQGEWFFIPTPSLLVKEELILRKEPLVRGGGKPHIAEEFYREGGEAVQVCSKYPDGVTFRHYRELITSDPELRALNWRTMTRNPRAYVRGKVRHPDHKTVVLNGWHRVLPNRETPIRNVTFLD